MADRISIGGRAAALGLAVAGLCLAGGAEAQTMNANSASYNAGYNRTADQENQAVNPTMRDANGNLVVVDGVIQAGQDQSVFSNTGAASGAFDAVAGVGGSGAATAFGNNLVVVTQGSNNTVIVNSRQVNSGNVSASSSLNGGVSNGQ
jgi:holdfast attachment protein HfaA